MTLKGKTDYVTSPLINNLKKGRFAILLLFVFWAMEIDWQSSTVITRVLVLIFLSLNIL